MHLSLADFRAGSAFQRTPWVALFSAHPLTKIEPFGAHLVPRIFLVTAGSGSSWGLLDFPPYSCCVCIYFGPIPSRFVTNPLPHGVQVVSTNVLLHNSRIFSVWATFIMKLLGVSLGNEGGGRRGAFLFGGFRIEWIALFSAHPTTKIEPFGAHLVPR